jgi:hypothetical protein
LAENEEMRKHMKSSGIAILTLGVLAFACAGQQMHAKVVKGKTIHPVLKTWVIPINSTGRVTSVSGESWKLDKNRYIELAVGSSIVYEDLLHLRKGSQITIGFEDNSSVTVDPRDYPEQGQGNDTYFTIEKKEQEPANQAL